MIGRESFWRDKYEASVKERAALQAEVERKKLIILALTARVECWDEMTAENTRLNKLIIENRWIEIHARNRGQEE